MKADQIMKTESGRPRLQINLIVGLPDKEKKKKVYNLHETNKIILNPSYLKNRNNVANGHHEPKNLEVSKTEPVVRRTSSLKLNKLKKTNVMSAGCSNKEDEILVSPTRGYSRKIWNRIKGSMAVKTGKSLSLDSDSRIVRVVSDRETNGHHTNGETDQDSGASCLSEIIVQGVIKDVLKSQLYNMAYDHEYCRSQRAELSEEIRDRLNEICHYMHKIMVNVFIGEVVGDIESSTLCTWNPQTDCVVTWTYKNCSLIAIATVFVSNSL